MNAALERLRCTAAECARHEALRPPVPRNADPGLEQRFAVLADRLAARPRLGSARYGQLTILDLPVADG